MNLLLELDEKETEIYLKLKDKTRKSGGMITHLCIEMLTDAMRKKLEEK